MTIRTLKLSLIFFAIAHGVLGRCEAFGEGKKSGLGSVSGSVTLSDGARSVKLSGVSLSIGEKRVKTDSRGRFTFRSVESGRRKIVVDGSKLNASVGKVRVTVREGERSTGVGVLIRCAAGYRISQLRCQQVDALSGSIAGNGFGVYDTRGDRKNILKIRPLAQSSFSALLEIYNARGDLLAQQDLTISNFETYQLELSTITGRESTGTLKINTRDQYEAEILQIDEATKSTAISEFRVPVVALSSTTQEISLNGASFNSCDGGGVKVLMLSSASNGLLHVSELASAAESFIDLGRGYSLITLPGPSSTGNVNLRFNSNISYAVWLLPMRFEDCAHAL